MAYDLPGGPPDSDYPADLETESVDLEFTESLDLECSGSGSGSVEAVVEAEVVEYDSPVDDNESGPGPENAPGSTGTEDDDDGFDVALLDEIERELADVELALERLGDGSYGRCETCGEVLSDEELDSAPAGRFCRAHLPLDIS